MLLHLMEANMTNYWYIWYEIFENGESVSKGRYYYSYSYKGNAVRLDVYYSKASGKAYLQLFEYIPYKYEPCSKIYEHEIIKVGKLIK